MAASPTNSLMAAGRGEFFRSYLEGLERQRVKPVWDGRPLGVGRGRPRPGGGLPGPVNRKMERRRRFWAAASPASCDAHSFRDHKIEKIKSEVSTPTAAPTRENLLEKLPSEILIQILSFLDAASLFCLSHVSKLFHRLASDDVIWREMYLSEFGSHMWTPKLPDSPAPRADPAPWADPVRVEEQSAGHWKRLYFRNIAGNEMNKWRRELRDVCPSTGLPRQTTGVLRSLNVCWELTLCNSHGDGTTLLQSHVYHFRSSVVVLWSGVGLPYCRRIRGVQVHAVRREPPRGPTVRKPGWRSLILKVDVMSQDTWIFGKDRLVKLVHMSPGFIFGMWRGDNRIAFIMVCLHSHKLVERSLLGSPACPYSEPPDPPPVDASDHEVGLHGYHLHLALHNTVTEIMSANFSHLSFHSVRIRPWLLRLKVIDRNNLYEHRSLSGHIRLPWGTGTLEGSVENCCIVTLTLLDGFQKPFWCVSSPVGMRMAARSTKDSHYSGEHFLMWYEDSGGQVRMEVVWLKEQRQFFLIDLDIFVPVFKVNERFRSDRRC